jgi:two-component system sensor histidine kinase BaeS
MSLRVRILALFFLVAVVTAAGAGGLSWYEARHQVTQTVLAGQRQISDIVGALRGYGYDHGNWDGVAGQVRRLSARTGQRIRLVDDSGAVLADSDLLAGHAARGTFGTPSLIDARPTLPSTRSLPDQDDAAGYAYKRLEAFRFGYRYASCLTRAGSTVTVRQGSGAPDLPLFEGNPTLMECANIDAQPIPGADTTAFATCLSGRTRQMTGTVDACLRHAFAERVAGFTAPPLQLWVGAENQIPTGLPALPIAAAAVAVALLVASVALVLSGRVLRPVRQLTEAAGWVADAATPSHIPVRGSDELAALARTFNRMADALADSRDRQRRQIADVAHELRSPLANLRGYLEALADGVMTPTPELFISLHEETMLQKRLIDDLHDLALAEAGALTYHRLPLDLAELAETCMLAHRPAAAMAGIALRTEFAGPAIVDADPDRLRQVVANLLTNAIRATSSGGSVTLTVAEVEESLEFAVSDTGQGIAADDLPHVFDRLWRADPARTRGGSGLGLTIARQIVTDHNGTLTATSALGKGSTFIMILPISTGQATRRS